MSTQNLILGTAGHIDHGKTSLIRALTGVNTDRLPEEKKRGITIELGYAHLELEPFSFGIVDVPGHEKFVRQMLAGATGMDIAMLVIAADDSIKPQTIEHLDILRMLDLRHGLIALTKCDLVEPDWLGLVEDEIQQFVKGSFLENCKIIRTSSHSGLGIDEIKSVLVEEARKVVDERDVNESQAPFRMAVDRTFTIDGHGTVVTGSVGSGKVSVGDQLEIQPGSIDVRVRGIQNHDQSVDSIARGQRGAINLVGIHHADIHRGQELAAKNLLNASRSMILETRILADQTKHLFDRQRIRFHIGTAEILGFVRILNNDETQRKSIEPGGNGILQVFLADPAVTVWNQPFVLRTESPVQTIGGGRVIHPFSPRINRKNQTQIDAAKRLTSNHVNDRVSALIYLSPVGEWNVNDLAASAGAVDVEPILEELKASGELKQIELSSNRKLLVHSNHLKEIGETIKHRLERFHDDNPLATGLRRDAVASSMKFISQPEIIHVAIDQLVEQGEVEKRQMVLGLKGRGPQLSKNEQALLINLIEQYESAGLKSPTLEDLRKTIKKNRDSIPSLLELAVGRGDLVKIDESYLLHSAVVDKIQKEIAELIQDVGGATISEIRQKLDASRKYAVPICEYLDKIKFTRREGDKRFLVGQ